jgi:hypothetical protein
MASILGISGSQYVTGPIVYSSDPQTGSTWEVTFEGPRDAIRVASLGWQAAGGRVRIDESGPISRAVVVLSGARNASDPVQPITAETPTDRWELSTDRVEVSLFDLPAVALEAQQWAVASNRPLAEYRKTIEEAVANGETLSINAAQYPKSAQVYRRLCRGQDSFPTTRINLVRQRSFTTSFATPIPSNVLPPVYRTSSLVLAFDIPATVANALPVDPPEKPDGTSWGWMTTDDRFSYSPKTTLVEQSTSWAFAAWDTEIYPHV